MAFGCSIFGIQPVLPLTREWIEIYASADWLKKSREVLPLTREWIEIIVVAFMSEDLSCSPSYEGVD